ncbi:MAG: type IV pilus modification protein PilV [Gammaproteobacteria bacterium]
MSSRMTVRGVSLVETLVALVVLSVGLLGVAALLLQSVRGSRTALLRTQAVNLVSDMADRIRANANAGAAYGTAQYGAAGPAENDCVPTVDNAAGDNCTVIELAQDDLARWRADVSEALPGDGVTMPAAVVQHVPSAGASSPERYMVSVAWQEPGEAAAPDEFSFRSDVVIMPRAAP